MPTLLLLCLLGLLSCLATGSASEYLYHVCPNTTTFNPNSNYETNLNFVIFSLSSNATRDIGFYNVTASRTPPDVAYDLFLCRGDVTSQVCQDCVATVINETVRRRCQDCGATSFRQPATAHVPPLAEQKDMSSGKSPPTISNSRL